MKVNVIGLRIEKYIGKEVSGHNCDFTYKDAIFDKHVICGIKEDGTKIETSLSQTEDICGSGWTTATYGNIDIKIVNKFNGFGYVPINPIFYDEDINIPKEDDECYGDKDVIDKGVFVCSIYGEDLYYPSGYVKVKMELFKKTVRVHDKRPVWIFKGDSNAGKSFLSSKLKDLKIYETDINNELLEVITQDVIILGNKYSHTINDIDKRILGEHNLIVVDFNITNDKFHNSVEITKDKYLQYLEQQKPIKNKINQIVDKIFDINNNFDVVSYNSDCYDTDILVNYMERDDFSISNENIKKMLRFPSWYLWATDNDWQQHYNCIKEINNVSNTLQSKRNNIFNLKMDLSKHESKYYQATIDNKQHEIFTLQQELNSVTNTEEYISTVNVKNNLEHQYI